MTILIVATGNPGKLKEIQEYLEETNWELQLKPQDLEIEETGTTFAENARLKAVTVAQVTGQWAIADDSGLAVDALNGRPGIHSARYGSSDGDRIQRLLRELGDRDDRQAQFICAIAIANPQGGDRPRRPRLLSRRNPQGPERQRRIRLRSHLLG